MTSRRRHRGRRPTRRPAPARTRLGAGEARRLALARDLAALAATAPPARLLEAALERLAPAPAASSNRHDKTRALAAAWAHEQARLAMQEILDREAQRGALRSDLPRPLLAWLLIAAQDALAHEPPDALHERLQTLGRFLRLTPERSGG